MEGTRFCLHGDTLQQFVGCAFYLFIRQPMGRKSALRREILWILRGFKRYLIHDRDPLFTEAVRGLLRDSGVKPLRLPANSPNLNAYAERFVLSIRRECLAEHVNNFGTLASCI